MSRARRILAVAIAVAGALAGPAGAGAQTLDFDPAPPAIGDFAPVTLNGTDQITSLTIEPFTIVDSTGSGSGWHVVLTVPDLVGPSATIAASNITMDAPVVTAAQGSSMTGVAGNASTGQLAAGEKIVTASAGNGAGTYFVAPALLKLTVPADARPGTYASTASIAVLSGP